MSFAISMSNEVRMKTICVIDDDATHQKLMNHHLSRMGFVVRSFFSGVELEDLPEDPFLIILDHQLTDDTHDGIHYLKKIKQKMPAVPVIYMTACTDKKIQEEAKRNGVSRFIEKDTVAIHSLRSTIDSLSHGPEKSGWMRKIWEW